MKLRRIDFYPDDFLVGVAGMTPEQIGVYWVINSLIYSSGGPIPEDDERIFRLVNCRPSKTKRIINDLKTCGKVFVNGSYLYCKRAVSEIETAQKRIKTAQENGAKNSNNNGLKTGLGNSLGNPPAPSPSPPPPTPPSSTSLRDGAHKKGTRLGTDWKPSEEIYAYGSQHNLTREETHRTCKQFYEYFQSPDATRPIKKDWNGACKRWIARDAPKIVGSRAKGSTANGNARGSQSLTSARNSILAEAGIQSGGGFAEIQSTRNSWGISHSASAGSSGEVIDADYRERSPGFTDGTEGND